MGGKRLGLICCLYLAYAGISGAVAAFAAAPPPPDSNQAAESMAGVKDAINAAIQQEGGFGPYKMTIAVEDGVVTLDGYVASDSERDLVEKAAASQAGIRGVNNKLQVVPVRTRIKDEELADKISLELSTLPASRHFNIGIAVKDGVVLLSGRAVSQADADLIEQRVRRLGGVQEVKNQIALGSGLSDSEIARRIETALRANEDISLKGIEFDVRDGIVTFRGSKPDHRDIDRILSTALMAEGVSEVRNEIRLTGPKSEDKDMRARYKEPVEDRGGTVLAGQKKGKPRADSEAPPAARAAEPEPTSEPARAPTPTPVPSPTLTPTSTATIEPAEEVRAQEPEDYSLFTDEYLLDEESLLEEEDEVWPTPIR